MNKSTIIRALLVLSCTTTSLARAQPADPKHPEDFLTYYYVYKVETDVPIFLKTLEKTKLLEKHAGAAAPMSAFLATLFSASPKRVTQFAESAEFTGQAKDAIIRALWLSGNSKKIKKIFDELPDYAKGKPVPLMERPLRDPDDLDMMWGAFMASGDTAYVRRIVDVLDKKTPLSGDKKADSVTRKAAEWSLKSNMLQHELVYRLIQSELKTRTGKVKSQLQDMVDSLPSPSFKARDGEFSAMLLAVDREQLEEFKKPTDQAPHISHKAVAHPGDIVGLKLIFSGIQLTDNLNADVRYDLKFLDPEGKPYCDTDLKNQEGMIRKIPTRFRIFDNEQVVMIRFEPKDKLGIYKIIATIRDKVGKKSITLNEQIELKE